jgi:hypothetical protein
LEVLKTLDLLDIPAYYDFHIAGTTLRAFLCGPASANTFSNCHHTLRITWKQAHSNELDENACEALCLVIEDCAASVTELKSILEKVAISPTDPGWKKSFKALASCFHDKEVAAIKASLSQSLTVINQYHGVYTATTTGAILKKLTAAVTVFPITYTAPQFAHRLSREPSNFKP